MAKFIITETSREIWKTILEVEAETMEEAELLYIEGNYEEVDREHHDTVVSEHRIEKEK